MRSVVAEAVIKGRDKKLLAINTVNISNVNILIKNIYTARDSSQQIGAASVCLW